MRWRLLSAFLVIAAGLGIIQLVIVPEASTSRVKIVTAASSINICPTSSAGAIVAIGSSGTRVSAIGKLAKGVKDAPFTTSKDISMIHVSQASNLVEKSTGDVTQIDTSSGVAGLACPDEEASYWFTGGSAALTSQDRLILTNAGHGDATATILTWSDKGVVPAYPVVVPAQASIGVGLDSIAPGVNAVVIHVLVRSGRIAASLYDQRSHGLTNLGSDFVSPGMEPAKKFVVLGVPGTSTVSRNAASKKKAAAKSPVNETRVLRLLSPLNDSTVRVDVVGTGDSFTPLGLDNIELKAGMVLDIPVTASLPSSAYAFVVTADYPVVAGVFSSMSTAQGGDIAWSSSTPSISSDAASADLDGTTYFFYSHSATSVEITSSREGAVPVTSMLSIPAEDVVSWAPKKSTAGVTAIRFKPIGGAVYASRLLRISSGVTASPLHPISVSGRLTAPLADVGVGMPR